MPKILNLIGLKIGRLLVIRKLSLEEAKVFPLKTKITPKSVKNQWWLAQCECGRQKAFPSYNLRHNSTHSCGCVRKEQNHNRMPHGIAAKRVFYSQSKRWAVDRKIPWDLSFDLFIELTSSPCFYCGQEPNTPYGTGKYNGVYIRNGIDRSDSQQGYIPSNSVPSCKTCNLAKHIMTETEFRAWVTRVYHHFVQEGH